MYHYVYELSYYPWVYIGCRSCRKHPELDTGYRGSGAWCRSIYGRRSDKTVLSIWPTREQALEEEARLIARFKYYDGDLCVNVKVPTRFNLCAPYERHTIAPYIPLSTR